MDSGSRGVSEFSGVAVLVLMTVLATASVGAYVLAVQTDTSGPPRANFSFQYIEQSSVLLVTHERGSEFAAGNLTIRSKEAEARWHELSGSNESAMVGPGDTVQLSRRNAYGKSIRGRETVEVVYSPDPGNETVQETWDGR